MTPYGDLPVVVLEGAPRARGLAHGRTLGDEIHAYLRRVRALYAETKDGWERFLQVTERYREFIGQSQPAALEEMEGIAQGAEVSLNTIVALSVDHEAWKLGGCTTIVALQSATASGHTLVGKTYDEPYQRLKSDALFVVFPDRGPRLVTLASIGTLSRDGFNEHGTVLLGSGLWGPRDGEVTGLPFSVLRRAILAQANLAGVRGVLKTLPRNQACNYTIVCGGGREACCFETTIDLFYEVGPATGLLVHTNHFLSPEGLAAERRDPASAVESRARLRQARQLLEARVGSLTLADIRRTLTDHTGYPGSICSHLERTGTLAAYWMDLDEAVLHVTNGPPCNTPAVEIPLHDLGFSFCIH